MDGIPDFLARFGVVLRILGSLVAIVLMVFLVACGLFEVASGVALFWGIGEPAPGLTRDSAALHLSLKGVEFIFLAPLAYMALVAVTHYMGTVRRSSAKPRRDGEPEGEDRDDHESERKLREVKAFVVSLLIAVLATDLLGGVLSNEGLKYEPALMQTLAIAVLAAYGIALHWLDDRGTT